MLKIVKNVFQNSEKENNWILRISRCPYLAPSNVLYSPQKRRNAMNTKTFEIPYRGHKPHLEYEKVASRKEAIKKTKPFGGGFHYAAIHNNECILFRQKYDCPFCNNRFDLSDAMFAPYTEYRRGVYDWAFISDDKYYPAELKKYNPKYYFVTHPDDKTLIGCSHCGYLAKALDNILEYTIKTSENATVLTQKIDNKDKYAALSELSLRSKKATDFPITLEIIFDHKTGRTHSRFDRCGVKSEELTELTFHECPYEGSSIKRHISEDTPLRAKLIEVFKDRIDCFPFSDMEITLEKFILLNRFKSFPRSFYDAIPFGNNRLWIESDFEEIAEQLYDYRNIDNAIKKSGLPDITQLRLIILEHPALLFYSKEILSLSFLSDEVLFNILRLSKVYTLLSTLHIMPGIIKFLSRFVEKQGSEAVLEFIDKYDISTLIKITGTYLSLSDNLQARMFSNNCGVSGILQKEQELSEAPFNYVFTKTPEISDIKIDSYHFKPLINTFEQQNVLNNIGKKRIPWWNWTLTDRPAGRLKIGVRRDELYIAEFSVLFGKIKQIELPNAEPIEKNTPLLRAICKWAEAHGIEHDLNPDLSPIKEIAEAPVDFME